MIKFNIGKKNKYEMLSNNEQLKIDFYCFYLVKKMIG